MEDVSGIVSYILSPHCNWLLIDWLRDEYFLTTLITTVIIVIIIIFIFCTRPTIYSIQTSTVLLENSPHCALLFRHDVLFSVTQTTPPSQFSVRHERHIFPPPFSPSLIFSVCLRSGEWPCASSAVALSVSPPPPSPSSSALTRDSSSLLLSSACHVSLCISDEPLAPFLHNVWASIRWWGSQCNSLAVKVQVAYLENTRKTGFDSLFCLVTLLITDL